MAGRPASIAIPSCRCNSISHPVNAAYSCEDQPVPVQAQGAAILQNLHGQRETIQRSQQRLHEADENISSSQKILRRMGRWLPF